MEHMVILSLVGQSFLHVSINDVLDLPIFFVRASVWQIERWILVHKLVNYDFPHLQ